MQDSKIREIRAWLLDAGMDAMDEARIVKGFSLKCIEAGLPLASATALIDTLHPIHEGRVFRWDSVTETPATLEYGPTTDGSRLESWQRSAFYHLYSQGLSDVRRRIGFGEPADFFSFDEMKEAGHTDVIAMAKPFAAAGSVGEMDCFYSNFSTISETGFSDEDIEALRELMPALGIAVKCVSVGRIARTIAEVYLGEDAADNVLAGKIHRGVSEMISSVLWFSDLKNFTQISDSIEPNEIIPFLNDYAETIILSVQEAGGTVLKLVGDGVLAIFKAEDRPNACEAALQAAGDMHARLKQLNELRKEQGKPITGIYLGLHVGDVFYGNVGSDDRLDFTVIGPAVNEVCRIANLCRQLETHFIMSEQFSEALPSKLRQGFVSAGHHALRGVSTPIELFVKGPRK
jgi:adenylate cyclase